MTVKELIAELLKFPEDSEVTITDGYASECYSGNFQVAMFDEGSCDIGIGGCNES